MILIQKCPGILGSHTVGFADLGVGFTKQTAFDHVIERSFVSPEAFAVALLGTQVGFMHGDKQWVSFGIQLQDIA